MFQSLLHSLLLFCNFGVYMFCPKFMSFVACDGKGLLLEESRGFAKYRLWKVQILHCLLLVHIKIVIFYLTSVMLIYFNRNNWIGRVRKVDVISELPVN